MSFAITDVQCRRISMDDCLSVIHGFIGALVVLYSTNDTSARRNGILYESYLRCNDRDELEAEKLVVDLLRH